MRTRDWKTLSNRLGKILPECGTESADVLEEAMHAAGEEAQKDTAEAVENSECRAKDPAHCRTHGTPREPETKGQRDDYGTTNTEKLLAAPGENMRRGMSVVTHIMGKKDGFEPKAMYRLDVGWIGVDYGVPGNEANDFAGGHGLSHILAKHPGAEKNLVGVLQNGIAYKHPEEERKVILIQGRKAVVLSKKRTGRLLITDFENLSDKQLADYTAKGKYHVKGENE